MTFASRAIAGARLAAIRSKRNDDDGLVGVHRDGGVGDDMDNGGAHVVVARRSAVRVLRTLVIAPVASGLVRIRSEVI